MKKNFNLLGLIFGGFAFLVFISMPAGAQKPAQNGKPNGKQNARQSNLADYDVQGVEKVCEYDGKTLCVGMRPGEKKYLACLIKYKKSLDPACFTVIDKIAATMAEKSTEPDMAMRNNPGNDNGNENNGNENRNKNKNKNENGKEGQGKACAADTTRFCAGMKKGDGKWGPCMQKQMDKLSPDCRNFLRSAK